MDKIQVLKQFTLVDQSWIEAIKKKYGHFGEKNFVDNLCNEIFHYYNGLFNVLVFGVKSGPSRIHIELTSNPLQHLTVSIGDDLYGVYIFKEGYFQIPLSIEPWCAYGSYSRTEKPELYELNFYYTNQLN